MELWSPANPLCLLANSTNIKELVERGEMIGWDCAEDNQAIGGYCEGWTGVRCNTELEYPYNQTVNELSLPGMGLEGSLSGMDLLEYLVHLDLSENKLIGTVPETIGSPTYLETLLLNSNKFTGELPNALFVLTTLQTFNVSDNHLRYVVPAEFGELSGLQGLDLAINAFEGSVPRELCAITGLQYLNFESNYNLHCYDDCLSSVAELITGGVKKCSEVENAGYKEELEDFGHGTSMVIGISGSGAYQYACTPKEAFDDNSSYPIMLSGNYGDSFDTATVTAQFPWSSVAVAQYGFVFACNSNGVYASSNSGVSWALSRETAFALAVATSSSGDYLLLVEGETVGEDNSAVWMNNGYGQSDDWHHLDVPKKATAASMDCVGAVIALIESGKENSLLVSTSYGEHWSDYGDVLPSGVACKAIEVGYNGNNMYLSDCTQKQGTEDVNIEAILMSDDYGQTWFNSKAPVVSWKHVAANANNGNTLWATSKDGLYYSSDQGVEGSLRLADPSTGWDLVDTVSSGDMVMATRTGDGHDGVYVGVFDGTGSRRNLRADVGAWSEQFNIKEVHRRTHSKGSATTARRLDTSSDEYIWGQSGVSADYTGVAMSNTSAFMVAVSSGATSDNAGEYISFDGGSEWQHPVLGAQFECVCSSGTGQYVYTSVAPMDGLPSAVTRSDDYGKNWMGTSGVPNSTSFPVVGMATSSTGQFVTAVSSYQPIYISSDFGQTYSAAGGTPVDSLFGDFGTYRNGAVAMSGSGEVQVVASLTAGVAISANYGANWTSVSINGSGYSSAAISSDGQTMAVASPYGNGSFYVSIDGGASFTAGTSLELNGLDAVYISLSADGTSLVAAADPGYVYKSTDLGTSWSLIYNDFELAWGAISASPSLDTILLVQSGVNETPLILGSIAAPTSMPTAVVDASSGDDVVLTDGEVAGVVIGSMGWGCVDLCPCVLFLLYVP